MHFKIGNVITHFIQTFNWTPSCSGFTCHVWITFKKLEFLSAEPQEIVMLVLNFANLELHGSN